VPFPEIPHCLTYFCVKNRRARVEKVENVAFLRFSVAPCLSIHSPRSSPLCRRHQEADAATPWPWPPLDRPTTTLTASSRGRISSSTVFTPPGLRPVPVIPSGAAILLSSALHSVRRSVGHHSSFNLKQTDGSS
jgi:hypothetical protein